MGSARGTNMGHYAAEMSLSYNEQEIRRLTDELWDLKMKLARAKKQASNLRKKLKACQSKTRKK